MRKIAIIAGICCLQFSILPGIAQVKKAEPKMTKKTVTPMHTHSKSVKSKSEPAEKKLMMTWTTKSPQAKKLAASGVSHMMNAEFAEAYSDLLAAEKLDHNFTIPLVFLTNLTRGEVSKSYAVRTLKSASDKTEGEKLFATLANEKSTNEERAKTWADLHSMFPDGGMLAYFYAVTRATADERFAAAQDYIKKFPDNPAMYNTIAYYYMLDKKDMPMAKQNLEKYLAMYPDGCNPYDSMGEYYLNNGDTTNAEKYYKLALEKYPFNISSVNALQKINDAKPKTEEKKPG